MPLSHIMKISSYTSPLNFRIRTTLQKLRLKSPWSTLLCHPGLFQLFCNFNLHNNNNSYNNNGLLLVGFRVSAVERQSLTSILSSSCARPVAVCKGKEKEEYLYSAFIQRLVSKRSDMDHTVSPSKNVLSWLPSCCDCC